MHCYAHRMNLVVVDACKAVKDSGDFFATLKQLYKFVSGSYVHVKWLENQLSSSHFQTPVGFLKLWRVKQFSNAFGCLMELIDTIIEEDNRDRVCEATALKNFISFNFVFYLLTFKDMLK